MLTYHKWAFTWEQFHSGSQAIILYNEIETYTFEITLKADNVVMMTTFMETSGATKVEIVTTLGFDGRKIISSSRDASGLASKISRGGWEITVLQWNRRIRGYPAKGALPAMLTHGR